jgi:acetolactate synthase-1/2/3 large subunit
MLNTTAALSTAYSCNTPVLLVTGQIPSALIGAKRGQLHELPDQLGILERLTKKALRMGHPAEAGETLNTLLREMWSGRPGPVAIEAAPDILAITAPTRTTVAAEMPVAPPFDADKVAQAARILGQAERPMILVGGGAFHASEEITALARMLSAPVQSWMLGRGVVDDRTGLSVNRPAAGQWWRETDAVLCIGSRGEYERATWGLDRDMAFIHVDIDPEELTRAWTPDIGILGDARDVAAALLEAIPAENRKRPGRIEEIAALRDRTRAYLDEKLGPQMAWLDAMRRALPEDGFFVEEFTQVGYVSRIGFPAYFPRSIVTPGYQGTLGYGYAAAWKEIGAEARQETGRWLNNRAENSHLPFRRRERSMLRFRRMRSLQKFASVHASVSNHFNQERSLASRHHFKANRAAALVEWRGLCAA